MLSSLLGSIIISSTMVLLLVSIAIIEKAIDSAAVYPITKNERKILKRIGYDDQSIKDFYANELILLNKLNKTKK